MVFPNSRRRLWEEWIALVKQQTPILDGGYRENRELQNVWAALQEEERQSAEWLNIDGHENLNQEVAGVGGSSPEVEPR